MSKFCVCVKVIQNICCWLSAFQGEEKWNKMPYKANFKKNSVLQGKKDLVVSGSAGECLTCVTHLMQSINFYLSIMYIAKF